MVSIVIAPKEEYLESEQLLCSKMLDTFSAQCGTTPRAVRSKQLVPLIRLIASGVWEYRPEVGFVFVLMRSGMPDFVTSTENMPFIQKFREHILPFKCEVLHPYRARPLTAVS